MEGKHTQEGLGHIERDEAYYVRKNMRKLRGVVSITDAYLRVLSIAVVVLLMFEYIAATFYFHQEVSIGFLYSAGIILIYGVLFKIFRYATRSRVTPRLDELLHLSIAGGKQKTQEEATGQDTLFDPPSARFAYAAVWPRYGMRKTLVAAVQTFVIILFAINLIQRLWWHFSAQTPAASFFPENIYIALLIVSIAGLLDILSNMLFLVRSPGMKKFAQSVVGMLGLAVPVSGQVMHQTLKKMAENSHTEMRRIIRNILHEHSLYKEVKDKEEEIVEKLMEAAEKDASIGDLYTKLNELVGKARGAPR